MRRITCHLGQWKKIESDVTNCLEKHEQGNGLLATLAKVIKVRT